MHTNPPEWLTELRRTGPYPRPVVAQKLGISVTALKKNDMDKPLDAAEIKELLENQPDWLRAARTAHAEARTEGQSAEGNATKSQDAEATAPAEEEDFVESVEKSLAESEAAIEEASDDAEDSEDADKQ